MNWPTHIIVVRDLQTSKQIEIEYRARCGQTDAYVVSLAKDIYGSTLEEVHKVKEVVLDTLNLLS